MVHIGFSTTNQLISRIIRFFTGSKVSHCFMLFELFEQAWVLEAGFFGISLKPLKKFQKSDTVVALVPVPLAEEDVARAMQALGEKYDFGGLLGSIFPLIGKWFKQKWKNPWNNSKALFCSEFCLKSLQEAGFPGADQLDPASTTPQDLLDFLTAHYLNQGE